MVGYISLAVPASGEFPETGLEKRMIDHPHVPKRVSEIASSTFGHSWDECPGHYALLGYL